MRIQLALATTTALALALSACGGASDTEDADTAAATAGEVVTDDAMTDAPEGETTDESEVTDTEDAAEAEAEAMPRKRLLDDERFGFSLFSPARSSLADSSFCTSAAR